jgi:hypothetical protein
MRESWSRCSVQTTDPIGCITELALRPATTTTATAAATAAIATTPATVHLEQLYSGYPWPLK